MPLFLWVYSDSTAFQCHDGAEGGDDTRSVHPQVFTKQIWWILQARITTQVGWIFHHFKLLDRIILKGRTLLKSKWLWVGPEKRSISLGCCPCSNDLSIRWFAYYLLWGLTCKETYFADSLPKTIRTLIWARDYLLKTRSTHRAHESHFSLMGWRQSVHLLMYFITSEKI